MTHLSFEEFQAHRQRAPLKRLAESCGGGLEDYSPLGGYLYPENLYVEITETKGEFSFVIHGLGLVSADLYTAERLLYHSLKAREG